MTAGALIAQVDALRPNQYPAADKLRWLETLDAQIRSELLETHESVPGEAQAAPPQEAAGETPAAYAAETELLVPAPWDEELYTACLFCRIDLMNAEIERYNQSAALFAAAWRQFADHLNRTRRPLGARGWKL